MKSRLEKLLAAARAHRRADDAPTVPPGMGRRLAHLAAAPAPAPDAAWLRGLAAGFACAALLATGTAFLPRAERESVPVELQILAGITTTADADQP